jgi:hypothetical protein
MAFLSRVHVLLPVDTVNYVETLKAVFNSWDRQPFLTEVGQTPGTPNLNPAYNMIKQNFFIGNYGAVNAIDNDDGAVLRFLLSSAVSFVLPRNVWLQEHVCMLLSSALG